MHVINRLHIRQRAVRKQIIHIKCMLRQNHARLAQNLRPIDQRMHYQILCRAERSDLIPCTNLFLWKNILKMNRLFCSLIQMIVCIIANQQIRTKSRVTPPRYLFQKRPVGILLQPVIRIHHLKIHSRGKRKPPVDTRTMPAVLLVHHSHNPRILSGILLCNVSCTVCRTVIDNDNLHIFPANDQRVQTAL